MFCRTCGAKMADDAQFCEQCGTAVTRQGTVQAPNGTTTETERVPAPEAAPAQGGTRPRKTAGKKLAVLCAAGALIIIAAVVCLRSRRKRQSLSGRQPEQRRILCL